MSFFEKIDPILAATFRVLLSTHDFLPIFFPIFWPLFSGGMLFLLWSWCPGLRETRWGARLSPFFPANAGGSALGATYLRQTQGAEGFSAHFLGGVFGSSVPFLFLEGWASEKEAAEARRAEELGSEEAEEERGEEERRRRKRRKNRRK